MLLTISRFNKYICQWVWWPWVVVCLLSLTLPLPTLRTSLYWNLGNIRWVQALFLNDAPDQLVQASQYWEQTPPSSPNPPQLLLYLGSAYERVGNRNAAIAAWQSLPNSMGILLSKGQQWLVAQSPTRAVPWFRGATLIAPRSSTPWYYLAQAFIQSDRPGEALASLKQALTAEQQGEIHRSQIYYAIGYVHHYLEHPAQLAQAISVYRAALATQDFPDVQTVAEIHFRLCDALWTQRAPPDQYAGECQKAIELNPQHLLAHYLLGIAYYEQYDDVAKAEQEFQNAQEIQPGPWGLVMLGFYVYEPAGMLSEARTVYQRALEQWPTFDLARQYLTNLEQRLQSDAH